jgi:hypothetical protein
MDSTYSIFPQYRKWWTTCEAVFLFFIGIKLLITEKVFRRLFGRVYHSSFNIQEFKECKTFPERYGYCKGRLEYLGKGTGRYVFGTDNGNVLKLARNSRGIAQNRQEHAISCDKLLNRNGIIGKVTDFDEKCEWLEMEWLDSITATQFRKKTGVGFTSFMEALYWMYRTEVNRDMPFDKIPRPADYAEIVSNKHVMPFFEAIRNSTDIFTTDSCRIDSYGLSRKDGKIKIRDAGLTNSVFQNYYAKQPLKMDMWL